MKAFWQNVLATVVAAALLTTAGMLYKFGERLARIEARLDYLSGKQIAVNP